MQRRSTRSHWVFMLAAAAAAAGMLAVWRWGVPRYELMQLVKTSGHLRQRIAEARLTDFPYAPVPKRGGEEGLDLGARAIAARLLSYLDGRSDSESLRSSGVASLFHADSAGAVARLEKATQLDPRDAAAWNDLAVARHSLAVANGSPSLLVDALAATDRALAERPGLAEARFNEGVIFEALGLHAAAIRSFERYVELDAGSAWSVEARERIETLRAPTSAETWKQHDRPALERAALVGDVAIMRQFVARYPQEARTSCETFDLPAWGKALEEADRTKAEERLRIVKAVANALMELHGDTSLADAVDAIEKSSGPQQRALGRTLVRYLEARTVYANGQVIEALPLLETVEQELAATGNPMRIVVGYYHGEVLYQAGQTDAAEAKLNALLAITPPAHVAYRAQILWILGEIHVRRGRLHDALAVQQESRSLFRRLGEEKSTCAMLTRTAGTLALLGRRGEAWKLRKEAFARLSRLGDAREMQAALNGAARTEALDERWETALPMLGVATDPALQATARVHASTMLWHALAEQRLGRSTGSDRIEAARQAAAALPDQAWRLRALLDVKLLEAVSLRASDPRRSIALLDHYVAEAAANDHPFFIPEALYQRALAWRAAGDDRRAESDLRKVVELLSARETNRIEQRSTYFRTGDEAARELADLLVTRGDAPAAFAVLGQARGASYGRDARPSGTRIDLPVAEYLALRDRLLVFVADATGVVARSVPVTEDQLRDTAARFVNDVFHGTESPAGETLAEWLIEPLPEHVRKQPMLAIVPDRVLARVPFGALKTPDDRFLIEETVVVLSPANTLAARPQPIRDPVVLAVGDPATESGLPPLPQAEREARLVARRYPKPEVLVRREATSERVLAAAAHADVLHFATHAVVVPNDPLASYLAMAPSENGAGILTVQDIHRATLASEPLIVLAGCRTGESPDASPRITNLAVAFLAAGATSVVGTLWDLPDSSVSTEISLRFHDELRRGADPASALRTAQVAMLHSGDPQRTKPSTWSAFQLWVAAKSR